MNVRSLVSLDHTADWRSFAKKLFELQDADPGYLLLARAKIPNMQKLRYVLAWCTYYNPGIAAIASEYQGKEFYRYLRSVYSTVSRASERRHFRGAAGLKALEQWESLYPHPEAMVNACFGDTYLDVRANMKHMAQMGDYFYWKMADIQDTVFGMGVDFTGCEKYMPKVPQQGAEKIWNLEPHEWDFNLVQAMRMVSRHIKQVPHALSDRNLLLQEAETVCCVFKQHVVGDYKYGFRTAKAVKRLRAVEKECKTAKKLLEGVWAGGIWTPERVDSVIELM